MIEKYILDNPDLLKYEVLLLKNNIRHKINVKENQRKLNYIWFNADFDVLYKDVSSYSKEYGNY